MDQDSVHMVAASKVPMLKPGEYEIWRIRMEQYIHMIDYSLWEVIENGNAPPITKVVEGVETTIAPSTTEEKAQMRLELKARSTLLMGILNEDQLKFNSIKDAKSLLQAIEKRFGGNAATKKTYRNLLKQYQLEIHGERISQEDINQKFLRNLSPEWNTHTIVWRNKPEIDTLSLDDLYNNLKIYEPEIAMLTIRVRRFMKNTGRKLTVNGNETIGFHKSKVECYNCHKKGHFTRECRPKGTKKKGIKENTRRVCAWRQLLLNALIFNSEVSTDSNCSSSCLENVKILTEQNEQLLKDLRTSKLNVITYRTCLESVEARLLVYKKNEFVYEEDIKIVDKCKTGLGYNVVLPPYTENFMPPKPDLSFSGLEEFVNEPIVSEPTAKKPVVKTSEAKTSADKPKEVRKNNGAPFIEDWVSDSKEEDVSQAKIQKKTIKPSFAKIAFVKSKEQVKSLRKTTVTQGSNFEMFNKACYVYGSFDHLEMTHLSPKRNMVPKAILMRSGLVSLTTARPANTVQPKTTVNSTRLMTDVFNKAHSIVRRPINNNATFKNSNFNQKVNTIKDKNVNAARPKAVILLGQKQYLMLLRETRLMLLRPQLVGFGDQSKKNI
ncbi:ribonuclease H-like domain-containing protein [Tanacetum coccineum]